MRGIRGEYSDGEGGRRAGCERKREKEEEEEEKQRRQKEKKKKRKRGRRRRWRWARETEGETRRERLYEEVLSVLLYVRTVDENTSVEVAKEEQGAGAERECGGEQSRERAREIADIEKEMKRGRGWKKEERVEGGTAAEGKWRRREKRLRARETGGTRRGAAKG